MKIHRELQVTEEGRIHPYQSLFWYVTGAFYQMRKDYKQAMMFFEDSVKLNPRNDTAWLSLGIVHIELGNWEQSIHCCEKAIEQGMDRAEPWFYIGTVLVKTKRYFDSIDKLNPHRK